MPLTDTHDPSAPAPAAADEDTRCTSLRETRARRTRATIQSTALRLAAERGYDATTVDDVAAAAGVSRRTVFNYFATKADMFILGPQAPENDAVEAFVAAPGHLLDDLAALLTTTVPATTTYGSHAEDFAHLRTILHSNPELSAELQQRVRLHASVIRAAIARRLGTTLEDPRVAAASALSMALFKGALDLWATQMEHCPRASASPGTAPGPDDVAQPASTPASASPGTAVDAPAAPCGTAVDAPAATNHAPESLTDAIGLITTNLRTLLEAESRS